MKFSIVIPIYNAEKYIDNVYESLKKQSYKNLEIIFINDGSTDSSLQKILDISYKDNRVKVVNQNNYGVATARNIGINSSQGEYIHFVDADDLLVPELYNNLFTFLKKFNSPDILIFSHETIDDKDKVIEQKILIDKSTQDTLESLFIEVYSKDSFSAPWNKLYKKTFLKQNNIFFPPQKFGEDALFNFNIWNNTDNIKIIDFVGYKYRLNLDGGAHHSFDVNRAHEINQLKLALNNLYKNKQFKNKLKNKIEISMCLSIIINKLHSYPELLEFEKYRRNVVKHFFNEKVKILNLVSLVKYLLCKCPTLIFFLHKFMPEKIYNLE